jgi:osmotically-inducible protein OsmY
MNTRQVFGTLAVLALTAACGNTADGAKQDAENAADKTAEVAADAGAKVEGALETGQVKTALTTDSRIDASDINVDTNEDAKSVTLRGTVPTEEQKKLAEEVATAKAVGYKVINDLTIKPK